MDNILKFLIKISSNEGNVVATTRNVVTQLDRIKDKARGVKRALNNAFSIDKAKASLMAIPGMEFLTNPVVAMGVGIGAVAKLGAQAESTAVAFKTLVGNEQKASSMLGEITDFAQKSPFGKMELVESAKQMLSFGVETQKVLPLMKQLGDISGGDKEKLSSLSLVMGQVSSTGYLMGQDLLQFINAGFNPIQELSEMTGKSVAELKDMMSKGQISAENVAQAIAHATSQGGKFYGMMDAQSQTLQGRFSTMVDALVSGAETLSQGINGSIGEVIDQITTLIPPIISALTFVFNTIGNVISVVLRFKDVLLFFSSIIAGAIVFWKTYNTALIAYRTIVLACQMATSAWTLIQWALNAAFMANPIGVVIGAVGALVGAIIYAWNKFAGFRAFIITMWDVIKQFGTIIKTYLIDRINSFALGLGSIGRGLLALFKGNFNEAISSFGSGVKKLMGADAIKKAVSSTKNTIKSVGTIYNKNLNNEQSKDNKSLSPQTNKISSPEQKGSNNVVFGAGKENKKETGKNKGGGRSAQEIATGGKRSTAITMNISKFFDTVNIHMADKTDTAELERIVVQSINRSLAIATSTDRG